jgi:hypothetical protein
MPLLTQLHDHSFTTSSRRLGTRLASTTIRPVLLDQSFERAFAFVESLVERIYYGNVQAQKKYDKRHLATYLLQNPTFYKVLIQIDELVKFDFGIFADSGICTGRDILKCYVTNVDDDESLMVFNNAIQSMFIKNYVCACNFPW